MFNNNPFSPKPEPTQFEQDINNLVEQLKKEVGIIHLESRVLSRREIWIYGIRKAESLQPENQDMRLFQEYADKLLAKYSHNLTETEPKNIGEAYQYIEEQGDNVRYSKNKPIAIVIALWIINVFSVSIEGNLDQVLAEIESLKNQVQKFKDFKPPKPSNPFEKENK